MQPYRSLVRLIMASALPNIALALECRPLVGLSGDWHPVLPTARAHESSSLWIPQQQLIISGPSPLWFCSPRGSDWRRWLTAV